MARLIATADGNLTTAATWGLTDATSEQMTLTSNQNLTTSAVASSTFTPGAITVDAIAIFLCFRTSAPSGTMTVELYNSTDAVSVDTVVVNSADIYAGQSAAVSNTKLGWHLFKFGTPRTLIAGKAYSIRLKTSVSSNIQAFVAAANNWARMLRTTTTQAPAAADELYVMGDWTAAGTMASRTVTNDETTTTAYGATVVGRGGLLKTGIAGSTNYNFRLAGNLTIYGGGEYRIGDVSNPIPTGSTAKIEFNCGSDGQYGLDIRGGNFTAEHASPITPFALLAADLAAAGTSVTTDRTTGWLSGHRVVIGSTTRNAANNEAELKTLGTNSSGTTVTLPSGVSVGHEGTGDHVAEIICLDQKIIITQVTSTQRAWILILDENQTGLLTTFNATGVEFDIGANVTNTSQISCTGLFGTVNLEQCSFHDARRSLFTFGLSGTSVLTMTNCVFYNSNTTNGANTVGGFSLTNNAVGARITLTDVIIMQMRFNWSAQVTAGTLNACRGLTINNLRISSTITTTSTNTVLQFLGSQANWRITDLHIHSQNCAAIAWYSSTATTAAWSGIFDSCKIWRNGTAILPGGNTFCNVYWKNCKFLGNTINLINGSGFMITGWYFKDCTFAPETSYTATNGILCSSFSVLEATFVNCNWGTSGTLKHSTNDIGFGIESVMKIKLVNNVMWATTPVNSQANLGCDAYIIFHRPQGVLGDTVIWRSDCTISLETSVRNTASGYAWKISPRTSNNGTARIAFPGNWMITDTFKKALASGSGSFSIYVRKDGTYDGIAPVLTVMGGMVPGFDTDATDTLSVGANTWEQLTVSDTSTEDGVIEAYLEFSGTTGNIYLDDAS